MNEKKRCYLCGIWTRRVWELPGDPTPRCLCCERTSNLRIPREPMGFFTTVAKFVHHDLKIWLTRKLEPEPTSGFAFWYASPLEARWFGHHDHPIKELTRYCHNTRTGTIYIPPGKDFASGCMLIHEVAHLMVGCGNSTNDSESYLSGYEHAIFRHLGLPLSVYYRWNSITGNDQTYEAMHEEVMDSRSSLEKEGHLKNGRLVVQPFVCRPRVYEIHDYLRHAQGGTPFASKLLEEFRHLEAYKRHNPRMP